MLRSIEVNITDRQGRPIPDLDVCAISLARSGQIDEVEATETTNDSGTCYFDLDEPCFFRPMLSPMLKREIRIQILNHGGQGILKHYVIDGEGFGTHTTVQAACTAATAAMGANEAVVIYINPGTHQEAVVVDASDLKKFHFVGEGAVVDLWSGTYASIARIKSPASPSRTGSVINVTGTGYAAFHGIDIDGDGSDIGVLAGHSVHLEFRNCRVATASGTCISSQDRVRAFDSILSIDTGRILTDAIEYEFSHCRLNGDGLFTGDLVALVLKDCFLFGTAPANEYWIHEEALVASRTLHIIGCRGSAGGDGGFVKYGAASANTDDVIITNNQMTVSAGEIWCRLQGVLGGVVTDNIIVGVSDTDGSTAIELNEGTARSCGGLIVKDNSIRDIQNGLVVNASATDGTCVIGPNAYYNVGTETTGVPDGENYQVNAGNLHDPVTLGGGSAAELSLVDQVLTLAEVLTPTEHTAIGDDAPHHAAVTLGGGSAAELTLAGQVLTLAAVLTPTEHTTIGSGAPHHAAVTLGGGSAPELTLSGQELTLAAVLTPTEHTTIGDSAPHHAKYTGAEAISAVEAANPLDLANTLQVDIINEHTPNAGVTIEGNLLKDSTIYIGGDANFFLTPGGGSPIFAYDSNDFWQYIRATNTLNFSVGGAVQFSFASGIASYPRGAVILGTDDVLRGLLTLYGHTTGATDGGEAQFHLSADHDGTFEHWLIKAEEDDLTFATSNGAAVNKMTPTGQLQLLITGSGAGILIGGDTQWYRSAANVLRTPDSVDIDGHLAVGGSASVDAAKAVSVVEYNTGTSAFSVLDFSAGQLLTGNSANALVGIAGLVSVAMAGHNKTGDVTGVQAGVATSAGGGTATLLKAIETITTVYNGSTVSAIHSIHISNPTAVGTLTENFGLYIEDQAAGGTSYAIYLAGTSGLARQGIWWNGDTCIYRGAANRLDLEAGDALAIHGGAGDFAAPTNGMLWYNTTTGKLRVYQGGAWADVA